MPENWANPSLRISDSLVQRLAAMQWPGNVRQLKNALERAAVLSEGRDVEAEFLLQSDRPEEAQADPGRPGFAAAAVSANAHKQWKVSAFVAATSEI